MDDVVFWKMIDASRRWHPFSVRRQANRLVKQLKRLEPSEILEFDALLSEQMNRLYHYDIWAIAYLVAGGCGDDMFIDFRANIVAMGKKVCDRAIRDPNTLLRAFWRRPITQWFVEGFAYVGFVAYRQKTGRIERGEFTQCDTPAGQPWEEDDLQHRFPRAWRRRFRVWMFWRWQL